MTTFKMAIILQPNVLFFIFWKSGFNIGETDPPCYMMNTGGIPYFSRKIVNLLKNWFNRKTGWVIFDIKYGDTQNIDNLSPPSILNYSFRFVKVPESPKAAWWGEGGMFGSQVINTLATCTWVWWKLYNCVICWTGICIFSPIVGNGAQWFW